MIRIEVFKTLLDINGTRPLHWIILILFAGVLFRFLGIDYTWVSELFKDEGLFAFFVPFLDIAIEASLNFLLPLGLLFLISGLIIAISNYFKSRKSSSDFLKPGKSAAYWCSEHCFTLSIDCFLVLTAALLLADLSGLWQITASDNPFSTWGLSSLFFQLILRLIQLLSIFYAIRKELWQYPQLVAAASETTRIDQTQRFAGNQDEMTQKRTPTYKMKTRS